MPRRWNDNDEYDELRDEPEEESQEDDDTRTMHKKIRIPTLKEIRQHVRKHAWNGGECTPDMSNYDVFVGQCEYASTAISEMLTGTGHNAKPVDWSLRIRGWYSGDLSAVKERSGCDPHVFTDGKHCHSWVKFKGLIIDATYWQFAGDAVRVYVFKANDPRYTRDDYADHNDNLVKWRGFMRSSAK